VILVGPPGVGKTSVLTALMDLLIADDVRHAAVEAEALARSFRERGYPVLLVAATVESEDHLQRLLDAAGPLAAIHADLPGVDLVFETEGAKPAAVAAAIRDAMTS
jgi:Ni2+-binding GTPase involved in maturation of urease and hydrogenase